MTRARPVLPTATPVYDVVSNPLPVAQVIPDEAHGTYSSSPTSVNAHPPPPPPRHHAVLTLEVRRRVRLRGHLLRSTLWWPATVASVPVGATPTGALIFNLNFEDALGVRAQTVPVSFDGPRRLRACGSYKGGKSGDTHAFRLQGGKRLNGRGLKEFLKAAATQCCSAPGVSDAARAWLRRHERSEQRRRIAGWVAAAVLVGLVVL